MFSFLLLRLYYIVELNVNILEQLMEVIFFSVFIGIGIKAPVLSFSWRNLIMWTLRSSSLENFALTMTQKILIRPNDVLSDDFRMFPPISIVTLIM